MKRITLLGLFICFATAVISCSKTELAAPEPPAGGNGDDTQTEDTTTTPLPPEEKPAYTVINQATEGRGIDVVFLGDGFTQADIESGKWEAAQDTVRKYFFHWEPIKSYKHLFNVYAVPAPYDGPSLHGGVAKGDTIRSRMCTYTSSFTPQSVNKEATFAYAYEQTPVKEQKGTPKDMFVALIINTDQGWGGWCTSDPFVDRPGWGRALVPMGIFYHFLYGLFTHELIGHGIGEFSDEYVQYGKDDEAFPEGEMGKDWYLKNQKEKALFQNVTFTTDPNDTELFLNRAWAEMIRRSYRGVGTVEGAVYYGKGVWRATEHSVMVGNGLFENYNYFNPVQREILLRHIYELAGKGDEYSLDLFFEYDKRNEAYDQHPNETNLP